MAHRRQALSVATAALVFLSAVVAGVSVAGTAAAQPSVAVDVYNKSLQPGEQTTIVLKGTDVERLAVEGDVDGWVVNETTPGTLLTSPNPSMTPYESETGDTWGNVFASAGNNTFRLVLTAPDEPGTYTFTAEGTRAGFNATEQFSITVTSETVTVDHAATVSPGEQTTITVSGSTAGRLAVTGDVGGWIVNETTPGSLLTAPNPSMTPYVSDPDDGWGHVFQAVESNTFRLVLTAPDEPGTYTFTATARRNGIDTTEQFSIEVAGSVHESGVTQSTFDAVAAGDDELSRDDVLNAVGNYAKDDPVNGVSVTRSDILTLVRYYVDTS